MLKRKKQPMSDEVKARLRARDHMTADERIESAVAKNRLMSADHIAQDVIAEMYRNGSPAEQKQIDALMVRSTAEAAAATPRPHRINEYLWAYRHLRSPW